jgi:hypothetical protein
MLPQALKLKVIQQYGAGKLQKDIAHDLGISTGSVSTILKASKDKQKNEFNSDSILQEHPSVVSKPEYLDLQQQQQQPTEQLPQAFSGDGGAVGQNESGQVQTSMLQEDQQQQALSSQSQVSLKPNGDASINSTIPMNLPGSTSLIARSVEQANIETNFCYC